MWDMGSNIHNHQKENTTTCEHLLIINYYNILKIMDYLPYAMPAMMAPIRQEPMTVGLLKKG
jgi:hypothetical protein